MKVDSFQKAQSDEPGLTRNEAVLAIISTIIGSGVTSVPYAMSRGGIIVGIFVNIFYVGTVFFSTYLYWLARTHMKLDHLSEMLYVTLGRGSIFVFNGMMAFAISGVIVVYMVLTTRICHQLLREFGYEEGIFLEKWPWVIGATLLLMPIYLRRTLGEMKM